MAPAPEGAEDDGGGGGHGVGLLFAVCVESEAGAVDALDVAIRLLHFLPYLAHLFRSLFVNVSHRSNVLRHLFHGGGGLVSSLV